MKLWMPYVSHKICLQGKHHLWGILKDGDDNKHTYIFYSEYKSEKIDIKKYHRYDMYLYGLANLKEFAGYKRISQLEIEERWPEILDDIEMEFMIEKLKD